MEDVLTLKEQENKRRGQIAGGIMLLLLLVLLMIPLFWFQNPPPGQEGIQVNLGIPDIGMGEDLTAPMATAEELPEEEQVEEEVPEIEEAVPPPPAETDPTPEPQQRDVVTSESAEEIAIRRQKEKEASDAKAKRDAERRAQEAEAERERQRKAEAAEAERKRKAREAASQATKNEIGGLFGSGSGGGTTNTPGDGGATNGDPNSSNIGKKSFGSGDVGGGLGNRGVTNSPKLVENSQASGRVVVSLCVDANGRVIGSSVKVTQRGTTTTDSQLRNAAIRNAKQWGFSRGGADRQCGTITYNFKVQ